MWLVVVVSLVAWSGCTGFVAQNDHDAGEDAGSPHDMTRDATAVPDLSAPDLSVPDLSVPDLATPDLFGADAAPDAQPGAPIDFECSEPWTRGASRTHAECLPRQVVVIESGVADPTSISVAHTAAGRVGISYEYPQGADVSELHLALFPGATLPSPSAAPITILSDGPMDRVGVRNALAASGTDDLYLAYLEVSSFGNAVNYCRVGACQPSSIEQVVGNFASSGELSITVDSTGKATVAAFNPSTGILSSYQRTSTWSAAKTIKSGIDTAAAGAGQVRLVTDANDLPVAALHFTMAVGQAQPRYSEFDGTFWSTPKTVDNAGVNGLFGFSIGVGLYSGMHYSAYFGQSGAGVVDLRLASWRANSDVPDVSVVVQALPVADFANPLHRSAIAVDKWGLVHLAILEPQSPGGGVLEYRRQVVVGGATKWIADIIDDAAVGSGDPSLVDLVVDDSGRPHIAYFNQANGKVFYATRFDR
jgi:hypothetical protein